MLGKVAKEAVVFLFVLLAPGKLHLTEGLGCWEELNICLIQVETICVFFRQSSQFKPENHLAIVSFINSELAYMTWAGS